MRGYYWSLGSDGVPLQSRSTADVLNQELCGAASPARYGSLRFHPGCVLEKVPL